MFKVRNSKTAVITGITGQDGSYLAELLLKKGYQVIGLVSRKHSIGKDNIKDFQDKLLLVEGDLLDKRSLVGIVKKFKPREFYNLGALTFVPDSWKQATLMADINSLGVTRLLEAVVDHSPETRFYQASTAKMFGQVEKVPQDEETAIQARDPYGISKAFAHLIIKAFRRHFGLFAVSGILYNHESERRGEQFVTRKISIGAVKIKLGLEKELSLGNLDAQQDWGYAPDYVKAIWLMLQQDKPQDFVIATGKLHSVGDVCRIAFSYLDLDFKKYVKIDKRFLRKEKGVKLAGDASKARRVLGWQPKTSFEKMIKKMVDFDLKRLKEKK